MASVQRSRRSSDGKALDTKQGGFRNRSVSIADIDSDIKVPSQKYLASRRNTISLETIKQRETANGGYTFKHHFTEREKEKQDLQAKINDLEQYKTKYEEEKKENKILQNRLSELMTGQSNTTQNLMRAHDSLDRLRIDQKKKTELIEKMQRDLAIKDDRIRNLEIKASEVEKAELILETTKQNLESTIQQVRSREGVIRKLERDIDDKDRQLETLNSANKDFREKVDDLRLQVRHELLKNDNIEKNLETIPRLKDTIEEKEDEIEKLKQQVKDKTSLLGAARKAARDYKEQLRNIQNEISRTEILKEDLHLTQAEVISLKKLMYGKDYLVTQKSKALDLSKEIIGVLNGSCDYDQHEKLQELLDKLDSTTHKSRKSTSSMPTRIGSESSRSDQSEGRCPPASPTKQRSSTPLQVHYHKDINVNHHPYSIDNEHHGNNNANHGNQNGHQNNQSQVFLRQMIVDSNTKRKRPMSAAPFTSNTRKSAFHRTSSLKEATKIYTSPLPRKNNVYDVEYLHNSPSNSYKSDCQSSTKLKPSLEYNIGTNGDSNEYDLHSELNSPRDHNHDPMDGEVFSDEGSVYSDDSDLEGSVTPEQEAPLRCLTARDRDAILQVVIHVGDRVLFTRQQKPPKYGKKRVLKPINYTGIIKFIGKFEADKDKYDARVFVGVRMDEPVGDTDGTHKGKRYMYVPTDQGKFYKAREITSVLNVKTGRYIPVKKLMLKHLHRRVGFTDRNNKGN